MLRHVPMLACVYLSVGAASGGAPSQVAVVWSTVSGEGYIQRFPAASPWAFDTTALEIGARATARFAGGVLYVVSRDAGQVTVIDADTWHPLRTFAVGADCAPVDIAVFATHLAYLSCAQGTHLLRFNPITGATASSVDLSGFADADGVPDMNMMAIHEGRLFVQLRRVDLATSPTAFVPPAMLAVVDLDTEQLIDADLSRPGVQAIELQGMAPKFKMQIVESTRRLFVSASGDSFDAGGLEMIDLDALASLGLIVDETDGTVGADLGAFVLITSDRGYLTYSTDLGVSSHMSEFTVVGGVVPGPSLFETVGYVVPTLPVDPQSQVMFFPDGGFSHGVHVLDAATGSYIATVSLGATAFPTDVIVFRTAAGGPGIPAISTWGAVQAMLLIMVTGSVLVAISRSRRSQEYWRAGSR